MRDPAKAKARYERARLKWKERWSTDDEFRKEQQARVRAYQRTPEGKAARNLYNARIRMSALTHYSGGTPRCACCGETRVEFLALDHITIPGQQHRRMDPKARSLARWAKNHGYPPMFRVLCHNCNMAIGFYGKCPHEL